MRHRLTKFFACILLFNISVPIALANPITYTAPTKDEPGKFIGELPLTSIGSILLPDGLIEFSDDEVKVGAVPDWLFDTKIVLRGAIVRAEIVPQKTNSIVAGLVYFFDGPWLQHLGSLRSVDVIDTVSGEQVRGRIIARVGQSFAVKQEGVSNTRKVNFSDIKLISSPRAFKFNIVAPTTGLTDTDNSLSFEASQISFSPTSVTGRVIASRKASLPLSTLSGTDPGVSNRSIAMFTAIDIFMDIVPAVAIPLVLQRSTQSAALNQIHRTLVLNQATSASSGSASP